MNKKITSENAPMAIGPYSQGILTSGQTIYVSGQLPVNPETGEFAGKDIKTQTRQAIENIKGVLMESGADLSDVVMVNVYMKEMNHFASMNEVYSAMFTEPFPARVAVEVARLPKDALVEISVVAQK